MTMHDDNKHDHEFDQAMRRLHAQAVAQVSPATRARLRVARQASAAEAHKPRRGLGWVLASGCAAVFALAIAVQLRPAPTAAPTVAAMPPALVAAGSTVRFDADTAVAALDENPDLYLWLASNDDALPAVMEQ